jgi:ribosome-associated translation inhibitor RaiA
MNVTIQTPGFKATRKLEKLVNSHLAKLMVMHDRIIEASVCLKVDTSHTKENKVCEIKLVIAGNGLFAAKQTESFEKSLLKTIAALKHQIAHSKASLDFVINKQDIIPSG